jgi:hypothetical protein
MRVVSISRGIMRIAVRLLAIIIACSAVSFAQTELGLKPLEATRAEADKSLNKGIRSDDLFVTYWRKREKIIINYSSGACTGSSAVEWDVPKDTIVSIAVFLENGIPISQVTDKVHTFDKRPIAPDLPGRYAYINLEEGRSFETDLVSGNEMVISYSFFPSSGLSHKKCGYHGPIKNKLVSLSRVYVLGFVRDILLRPKFPDHSE